MLITNKKNSSKQVLLRRPLSSTTNLASLLGKYKSHQAHIAVIGMGYVGLPLSEAMINKGFHVTGLDVDASKIDKLANARSYLRHIDDSRIDSMLKTERFLPATDAQHITEADAVLICVPTPLKGDHEPDISYIVNAAEMITPYLQVGQLIVLESSTYPGTTRDVLIPTLEKSGLKAGEDFYVAFSPEREDPGNHDFSTSNIPKIVGGLGAEAQLLAQALYQEFIDSVVPVSSPEVAEAAKLLENIFRDVNIALVNELKMIFDAMNIDIWEVIQAASTKPFGFMPFYPGPGVGGHCIPLDPYYLTWKAHEYNIPTRFIELAGHINEYMPQWVMEKLRDGLAQTSGQKLDGANILLLGLSYKKDIDDLRMSPALSLASLLYRNGVKISFHDPFFSELPDHMHARESSVFSSDQSVDLTPESLKDFDAAVIVTAHSQVDYDMLLAHSNLVIDTQNVLQSLAEKYDTPIIKA